MPIKTERLNRMRAANEELIRLGMLVDSGKPLNGRVMWMPNPRLTEERQLTEQQRKALIESECEGADPPGKTARCCLRRQCRLHERRAGL
jgi:hypothetical protein